MSRIKAILALEDGTTFSGTGIGAPGAAVGEVVFNTAMTGYQEILTDPSYLGQLVTLTASHVGNTGANEQDTESAEPRAAGLIVRDCPRRHSSWRATESLPDYLLRHRRVAIAGVDTRALTVLLREKGAQNGCILAGDDPDPEEALARARACPVMTGQDLAGGISCIAAYTWRDGLTRLPASREPATPEARLHVVCMDFGVKRNILRLLVEAGCRVTVVPANTDAETILDMSPDGVLLSNGPGDPEPVAYGIEIVRDLLEAGIPILGICLGHQLLALAAGAKTMKMKFGHHGANHPVMDTVDGRVVITSQNHGFAVDEASLPANARATHRSLFDGSLQGIRLTDRPAFSFQGHPEASPGPHDLRGLFLQFIGSMESSASQT